MTATDGRTLQSRWLGRRVLFRVAGVAVPSFVALLYVGCVAGAMAGAAAADALGLDAWLYAITSVILLIPALVGARLWYALQHLSRFRAEPQALWRTSDGGAGLYGGLVLSLAVCAPVLAVAGLPFWRFWDAAGIHMMVGMVIARFGCLMNGCCCGRASSGVLGVWLPNHRGQWVRRIPTQILEALWGCVVLAALAILWPRRPFDGALFAGAAAGYAAGRLVLEATRESFSPRAWRSRVNQVFSALLLVVSSATLLFGWR